MQRSIFLQTVLETMLNFTKQKENSNIIDFFISGAV